MGACEAGIESGGAGEAAVAAAVQQITAEVLQAALKRILAREPAGSDQLLGCDMTERALRFGLERSYRAQAQLSSDRRRRTMLVDMANEIRPSTWS